MIEEKIKKTIEFITGEDVLITKEEYPKITKYYFDNSLVELIIDIYPGHIELIYFQLATSYQQKGIGRALIGCLLPVLKAYRNDIRLTPVDDEISIFWEKLGFEREKNNTLYYKLTKQA